MSVLGCYFVHSIVVVIVIPIPIPMGIAIGMGMGWDIPGARLGWEEMGMGE